MQIKIAQTRLHSLDNLTSLFKLQVDSCSCWCREELIWLYQEGASYLYPDHWEDYIEPIPKVLMLKPVTSLHDCVSLQVERGDLMSAYHRRLTGSNEEVRIERRRGKVFE